VLPEGDALSKHEYLVMADLDGDAREARVFLAAPVTEPEIERHFAAHIVTEQVVAWDSREQAVIARRRRRLEQLVLRDEPLRDADPERVKRALLQGIRERGGDGLPWSKAARQWQQRVLFVRRALPEQAQRWPDVGDVALLDTLEQWLAPYVDGMTRLSDVQRLALHPILTSLLEWKQQKELDELAPTHVVVPSGSRIPVDYEADPPVLAVRLQEVFGLRDTPRVANGRVALTLHLLSPARRPVQVTRDLASFWANTYQDVKKDLKGRYPKHSWPDDPLQARPTHRAKPRGG
jgi:ATP-dependent helicase HrpB